MDARQYKTLVEGFAYCGFSHVITWFWLILIYCKLP